MSHPLLKSILPLLHNQGLSFSTMSDLPGSSFSWIASLLAKNWAHPVILVTEKASRAEAIYRELLFFASHDKTPLAVLNFPAWETLPFEQLSPFGPLVGERISTLFRLTQMSGQGAVLAGNEEGHTQAIVITTAAALMQRVMPASILSQQGFAIKKGDQLNLAIMREFLASSGYRSASQVVESGEFAVRGGIVDFFPPGQDDPVRIELFGDEVETLRQFDPVTQRSTDPIPGVQALPISEVILNEETIRTFRTQFRQAFGGDTLEDPSYREISKGNKVQGMEHWLPLFYEPAETFFDYLPQGSVFLLEPGTIAAMDLFATELQERYETVNQQNKAFRHLPPDRLYLNTSNVSIYCPILPFLNRSPPPNPCLPNPILIQMFRLILIRLWHLPQARRATKRVPWRMWHIMSKSCKTKGFASVLPCVPWGRGSGYARCWPIIKSSPQPQAIGRWFSPCHPVAFAWLLVIYNRAFPMDVWALY